MKRFVAFISIAGFTAIIMAYLWWGRFRYDHASFLAATYCIGGTIVALNHWYFGDSRRALGLRTDNLAQATYWFGGLTLAAAAGIGAAGLLWGNFTIEGLRGAPVYLLWAGVQQYLLQNFLRLRALSLFTGGKADSKMSAGEALGSSLIAGAIFGLIHAPEPVVVGLTFVAGVLWCLLFTKVPSFPWAWLSHVVLGLALLLFFKQGAIGEISVGQPGHRYEYYGQGVVPAGGYDGDGNPFIATLPGSDRETPPLVRVFDVEGRLVSEWVAFEGLEFSGRLAVGDLGWDAGDEIVVSPGPGPDNLPLVAVFDREGRVLSRFRVEGFPDGYGAGVSVACGGILVSPGPGPKAPKLVVQVDPSGREIERWSFPGLPFENGVKVAGICDPADAPGNGPPVRMRQLLLWGSPIAVNPSTVFVYDVESSEISAVETLPTTFGANACLVKLGQGRIGFAVAPGPLRGYPPWAKVFSLQDPPGVVAEIVPSGGEEAYGSNLSAVDVNGDGVDELIFGEGTGPVRPSTIRIVGLDKVLQAEWNAYD